MLRVTRKEFVLLVFIFLVTLPIVAGRNSQDQSVDLSGSGIQTEFPYAKQQAAHHLTRLSAISSQSLGGGMLTLAFSDSFPLENRSYAQGVFDLAYPELVSIYGAPAQTSQVLLDHVPGIDGTDGCTPPTVQIGFLPHSADYTHTWDATFIHELLHTFHCGVSIPYPWAEEGMTTLAQYLVMQRLVELGKEDFLGNEHLQLASALLSYDAKQYLDPETFQYWWAHTDASPAHYPGAAFFFILSTLQNGFLSKLNGALYAETNSRADYSDGDIFDRERFVSVLERVLGNVSIDGLGLEQWIDRQSISYVGDAVTGQSNAHIVLLPDNPENFDHVSFTAIDSSGYIHNLHVSLQIKDVFGKVAFQTIYDSADKSSFIDVPQLPDGAYEIVASTEYGGRSLIGITYGIRQSAHNNYLSWPKYTCDCIFGALMNSYGDPIQASITTNGTLRENTNGAFVIDTSSPQVAITVGSETKVVTKPGPYGRVVWLPARTSDDFSISVSPGNAKVTSYGGRASYTVTISSAGNFQGIVWVTAAGYPSGFGTATLEPSFAHISPSNDAAMSLTFVGGYADAARYQGSYKVTLVAKSGPLIHVSMVLLDVTWLLYVEFRGNSHLLEVLTNSSITRDDFQYDPRTQSMNFTVRGRETTQGFMNATLDAQLISGPPVVSVEGNVAAYTWSRVNSTHYSIHVSYSHSTRVIAVHGSEPVPTELKIEASPGTVNMTRGENVTIQGSLLANGYYPLEGIPVRMEYSPNSVEWIFIASVTTRVDGRFSYSWLPPSLGTYMLRARWDGDSTYSNATSANATAQVAPEFFNPVFTAIIVLALAGLVRRPLRSSNASQTTRGPCLLRSTSHYASFCLTQYVPPVPSLCP